MLPSSSEEEGEKCVMCGITGFINSPNKKASLAILRRMNKTIVHRGPDDSGEKIIGNVALANRRLAVIDLTSGGHQPMRSFNKKIWITYNGEIYNFKELRSDLLKKGYKFRSTSDTEVIANLYQEYGLSAIKKLRGMFAFAIWDGEKRQLVLARDRFGIKPLYYYYKNGLLIFGSEIKSILAHPQVKKSLDLKSLSLYFSIGFGVVPSPFTIFKNIKKLPPAHYAVFKNGKLSIKKYWHLEKTELADISENEAKEQLLNLINQSVKSQLVSDVPLGAFLSGGIDSSLVVALMTKHADQKPKTFTIGFDDPNFDESKYAQKAAKYLNTNHHVQKFKIKTLIETLPEIAKKIDEPLADASILPTYLLSKFTRKRVTVALSGDGGDELFAGYPTYIAHKLNNILGFIPVDFLKASFVILEGAQRLIGSPPKSEGDSIAPLQNDRLSLLNKLWLAKHSPNLPFSFKLKRLISGWNKNLVEKHLNFIGSIALEKKPQLFTEKVNQEISSFDPAIEWAEKIFKKAKNFDTQAKLQFFDFYSYLSEQCLVKTDRASSFNSLEVRVPFLTKEIAEFAFSLPSSFKLKGFQLKYIFKKIAAEILPEEIINRPKKGFGIPIHKWLKTSLKKTLIEKLSKKPLEKQGLFNYQFIKQLIDEHLSGQADHRMVLWNLLMFQYWYENFCPSSS